MFVELFEKLRKVTEATATATANPQKVLKDYYKDESKELVKTTWPSMREENWYKFWLLTDGIVIPVKHSHHDTAHDANVYGDAPLLKAGAARGYIDSVTKELGVDAGKKLTKRQIHQLINLYIRYKATSVVVDIPGESWKSDIKSSDHLDYLLTYGKDVDEADVDNNQEERCLECLQICLNN